MTVNRMRDKSCKRRRDEQFVDACQHGVAVGLGRYGPVRREMKPIRLQG